MHAGRPSYWTVAVFLQAVILPGNLPFSFSLNLYLSKIAKMWLREGEGTVTATLAKTWNVFHGLSPQEAVRETPRPDLGMETEFYRSPQNGPSGCPTW